MNILVLNASPKGKNSTTVHTALYLQALHPEHVFSFLSVGQQIKAFEKRFYFGTSRTGNGRFHSVLLPRLYFYCTISVTSPL